jgi:cytochrome c biogenesis protein
VRAVRGADGVTVVELAGLGRSESAKIADELGTVVDGLLPVAPQASEDPPEEPEDPTQDPTKDPTEDLSAETRSEDEGARA